MIVGALISRKYRRSGWSHRRDASTDDAHLVLRDHFGGQVGISVVKGNCRNKTGFLPEALKRRYARGVKHQRRSITMSGLLRLGRRPTNQTKAEQETGNKRSNVHSISHHPKIFFNCLVHINKSNAIALK